MRSYRWTLDLQLFSQEKTENATPKKRQDSYEKRDKLRKVRSFQGHSFIVYSLAFLCLAVIIKNG